jgi:hypothetical protein
MWRGPQQLTTTSPIPFGYINSVSDFLTAEKVGHRRGDVPKDYPSWVMSQAKSVRRRAGEKEKPLSTGEVHNRYTKTAVVPLSGVIRTI